MCPRLLLDIILVVISKAFLQRGKALAATGLESVRITSDPIFKVTLVILPRQLLGGLRLTYRMLKCFQCFEMRGLGIGESQSAA